MGDVGTWLDNGQDREQTCKKEYASTIEFDCRTNIDNTIHYVDRCGDQHKIVDGTQSGNTKTVGDAFGRVCLLCAFFLAGIFPFLSAAQELPMYDEEDDLLLSAQFIIPTNIAISSRPTPLRVPLIWRGDRLLRGRLHYHFYAFDPSDPVLHMVSTELTLDQVPRQLDTMLPAIPSLAYTSNTLSVDIEFIEQGNPEPFDLETHSVQLESENTRHSSLRNLSTKETHQHPTFTIAVVHRAFGSNLPIYENDRLWWTNYLPSIQSLRTFREDQDHRKDRNNRYYKIYPAITHSANLSLSDLPDNSIKLTGYDAISLQQGITDLNKARLITLAKWIRTGGKVILATTVNAGEAEDLTEFLRNAGCLFAPVLPLQYPKLIQCDLGKVLLLPAEYTPLKRSHTVAQKITKRKANDPDTETVDITLHENAHVEFVKEFWDSGSSIDPFVNLDTAELLAPAELDSLPVKSIILCLALFLIAATPIDYFLLGRVRKRNLTWIVYPIAALACSFMVVKATNRGLTGATNGQWKIITLGNDGAPIHAKTFRLLLNDMHSSVGGTSNDTLYSTVPLPYQNHGINVNSLDNNARLKDWTITGNYPVHYSSTSRLARLTPAIESLEEFFPEIVAPEFPWLELDPWQSDFTSSTKEFNDRITDLAQPLLAPGGCVHTFTFYRAPEIPDETIRENIKRNRSATAGDSIVCVPNTKLSEDLACVGFTLQDGNHFTTYVRLFPKPPTQDR